MKHIKGRRLLSTEEATLAVDRQFAAWPKEFFLARLKKLEQQSHKDVHLKQNVYSKYVFSAIACCFLYKAIEWSASLILLKLKLICTTFFNHT
jgi:hypothetical protein